ncbi:MAG: histidine phosphatase family protein [Gammaproteobacteria bacterium]|nr:histidine phosphatase family protein [Gammaproteobacteria bacterium]
MPERAQKTLCLIRHAEAVEASVDIQRNLSATGQESMAALNTWFAARSQAIDYVLCSSSIRTRQTCAALLAGFSDINVDYRADLYLANTDHLIKSLQGLPAAAHHVILIGHNPGLSDLANVLVNKSMPALPTAGAVIFQFQGAWPNLSAGAAYLIERYTP